MRRKESAQPKREKSSRKQLLAEIPDLVSSILNRHLEESRKYAHYAVRRGVKDAVRFAEAESKARRKYLPQRKWTPPQQASHSKSDEQEGYVNSDPSLLALDAIARASESSRIRQRTKQRQLPKIIMPQQEAPPKYDTWIPVRLNYWVGKDLHVEPYMPFLGDQDHDCELAFEVFEDMADDAGKQIDLSDGEVSNDGTITLPRNDIDRVHYYSMPQAQWRAGTRKAILAVLDRFPTWDDTMWKILGTALGFRDIRRVKAVAKVAQERRLEYQTRHNRRAAQIQFEEAINDVLENPEDDEMPIDETWSARMGPSKHFCLVCHTFRCLQHENFSVDPVLPIADASASAREADLGAQRLPPCSRYCFLRDPREGALRSSLKREWTAEEILLLRESVPVFGFDPCSLAQVIGSRSCTEVSSKLKDPLERDVARFEIQQARKVHVVEEVPKRPSEVHHKKDAKKVTNKTPAQSREPASIDQDFTPCYHKGPCTHSTCSCVKKEMYCETTCACCSGRYAHNKSAGGVTWTLPSGQSLKKGSSPRKCQNRHYGCNCEVGHCSTSQCPCWDQNRACNPDLCRCDAAILPQFISLQKRRCRNTPTTIATHKKTQVGKSNIHGFGLFAGERFEEGDLVGIYSGQIIDTRLADMIGRLYDAMDRTYIFNVTESLVIDGGLLGSKAKFCNHTKPGERENCASRLVRVRGDAYVALFCKRAVEPGEEFLFDYRFTGEVPGWAKEDKSKSR